MMRYVIPIATLVILTSSCLNRKTLEDTPPPADSTDSIPPVLEVVPPPDSTTALYDDDCVFDTSAYKFTTTALKKYKADIRFKWNKEESEAQAVVDHGDTLWLHIGGCDHFSYAATLSTAVSFTDSAALAGKSLWLARTFFDGGFDDKYAECISKGLFRRTTSHNPMDLHAFEIIDPDTAVTNQIFEGFSFENQGARTRIVISGYVN